MLVLELIAAALVGGGAVLGFLFYGSAEMVGRILGHYDRRKAEEEVRKREHRR